MISSELERNTGMTKFPYGFPLASDEPNTVADDAPLEAPYFTCIIPYVVAKYATEWHPVCSTGPFATISRGCFKSEDDAIEWAKANLNGCPYSIKKF